LLRRKGVASGGISLTLDPFQLPRNRNFTRSGDDGTIRNLDNLTNPPLDLTAMQIGGCRTSKS
jgi:hypothetical protein